VAGLAAEERAPVPAGALHGGRLQHRGVRIGDVEHDDVVTGETVHGDGVRGHAARRQAQAVVVGAGLADVVHREPVDVDE